MIESTRNWHRSLRLVILALGLALWATPASAQLNLSDIVAGGDGSELGWTPEDDIDAGGSKYAGVNLDNGTFMTRLEIDPLHGNTFDLVRQGDG